MSNNTELRELRTALKAADTRDQDEFRELLNLSMDLLKLTDDVAADLFEVSRPSVNRWRRGITAPHHRIRGSIYDDLIRRVKKVVNSQTRRASRAASVATRTPVPALAMAAKGRSD